MTAILMQKQLRTLNHHGFTLLELLSVMVIMGVLASVTIHRFDLISDTAGNRAIASAISELNVREALTGLLGLYVEQIDKIFESIVLLLGDSSENVRISAISAMVDIINKISLEAILSKLLQNLSDQGSLETQRSIATILGRTAKYKDNKVKKRIIALLKIRCEMSQDPLLCRILNELRESMND